MKSTTKEFSFVYIILQLILGILLMSISFTLLIDNKYVFSFMALGLSFIISSMALQKIEDKLNGRTNKSRSRTNKRTKK